MLPIIPIHTSKQKNTTSATVRKRRPRALLTSTAVAASKKKKKTKSPTESPQERSNVEEGVEQTTTTALKEPPSSTTVQHHQQQHQPLGKNNANDDNTNHLNNNNNDEEDALVLAAEAAAALMDDLPQHTTTDNHNHNSYVDNIPMGLLDETVNFAANIIMRGGNERQQVQEQQEGDIIQPVQHEQNEQIDNGGMKEGLLQQEEEEEGDQDTTNTISAVVSKLSSVNKAKQGTSSISQVSEQQQRKNLDSITQSTTRRNNVTSTKYELTNPLGKNVQTFTTNVPTSSSSSSKNNTTTDNSLQVMTMSAAQKNFISHYYYNNGVEGSMDNAILGGLSNKHSSKTKKKSGDDGDDDDEEVVDTNDDKRKSDNMAASEGGGGVSSEKENVTKEKEGGEEDDEASAMAMGGDSGGKKHVSTLRSVCQSIPRSMKRKDPKNDKLKRGRRKKQKLNGDGAFGDDGDVHLLPKDEQVNVMQIEDPTTAVGDSGMGVANNGKDATAPDQQNTDQQPQEEDETAVAVGPQVEVDEHGQIVIAQDSLLPNPETRQSTAQIDEEFGNNVVDEGETPARLGAIQARYDSYTTTPRQKPVRWSVDETKLFYRALRQCGTDFTMMQMFLVGRTRSQLKSKFKIEGRKNARLVDMALNPRSKVKLDLSVFGELEIPKEVPQLRVLQSPVSPVAAAATYGGNDQDNYQQGGSKLNNRGSMESTFDHLFDEEEVSPGAAADYKGGKDTSQEIRKGKTEKGGQVQQPNKEQALAPVIAPPGPKVKVKKPFRPSKPKKTGSAATKKK